MSDNIKNPENELDNNFFADAQRDEDINLGDLIRKKKTETNTTTEAAKPKLSPLEQMKADKAANTTGLVVDNEKLKQGDLRNPIENDDRLNDFKKEEAQLDSMIDKRKYAVQIRQPQNQFEFSQLTREIDAIVVENGKASINLIDGHGEKIEPQFIRLRTENDPEYGTVSDRSISNTEVPQQNTNTEVEDITSNDDTTNNNQNDDMKDVIKVIIDKTGFGTDFMFNEEEKKKVVESSEIRLTEVSFMDIETLTAKTDVASSYQDAINAYNLSNSQTTVCFPASGFRASMKGMTYGELADVSLNMESVTADQYRKRLTVIYNKMTNISTGPFESFDDFLRGFAYVDIPMALYGLYVSTQPEVQQIQLRCGKDTCNKTFDWGFSTRSVLRLEKCSKKFLLKMEELVQAKPEEYQSIRANSAVMKSKFIQLPYSKFVIEMGVISAYEFLNNFIPILDEEKFHQTFGADENGVYLNSVLLLTTVRSVRIPKGDGTYSLCNTYKSILDAIYSIMPEEIKLVQSFANVLTSEYNSAFSFGDVTCPHCGNVTKDLDLTMDDLVFQTYQRLISTEINVENIQGL
jgi:hypothetical protein